MKKQNPLHQLPLRQKIMIAFTIPIIMTMTVSMFAVMGHKQIEEDNHAIMEKASKHVEVVELLEHSQKRIRMIQQQLIMVTVISIILLLLLAVIISRSIHVTQQAGNGLPEEARNELLAMRQRIDEILRKY